MSLAPRSTWFLLVLILEVLGSPGPVWAGPADPMWKPYLEERKGEKQFPQDPLEMREDKWLRIHYPEYAGRRRRIDVVLIPTSRSSRKVGKPVSAEGPDAPDSQVRRALAATNRFAILGGSPAGESRAEFTVQFEVLELHPVWEAESIPDPSRGAGEGAFAIPSVGISGKVAWARLRVRVFRTESDELLDQLIVDGTDAANSIEDSGGAGAGEQTAARLTRAIQVAANKTAYFTATRLQAHP